MMTRTRRALLLGLLGALGFLVVVVLLPVAPSGAAGAPPSPRRILVITAPALTWAQVKTEAPEAILGLLEESTVASMSVRTIGPRTTPAEGYATLGSGNRAAADEIIGGLAFDIVESFEARKVSEVRQVRTGSDREAALTHLSVAEVTARNRALRYGAVPGTLAEVLRRAGRSVAAIGNADSSRRPQLKSFHREVALAAMDRQGGVAGGSVAHDLLVDDPDAPFGVRLDPSRVQAAVAAALERHDVVFLELSDLERADQQALSALPRQAAKLRSEAMEASDGLVGDALELVDLERDLVIFATVASSRTGKEHLGVAGFAGPGFERGLARSGTTRRSGYVTLPDIAPTILTALDLAVPIEMTGAPVASGADTTALDLAALVRADERATFRDRVQGPTSVAFIVVQVLAYAAALMVIRRPRNRGSVAVGVVTLVTLGVPPAAFLLGLLNLDGSSTAAFLLMLYAVASALAGVAFAAFRRRAWAPPVALLALALIILVADVVLGGYLQIDTVFGYSPIVAGRFAGFGNLAFALLAATSLVVGTVVACAAPCPHRVRLALAGALFGVVVVVDGLPSWGADVGGVLATVPGFMVALAIVAGARLGWRRLIASGIVAGAVVAIFAAIDLARPAADQTHLGRLARRAISGEGVATIIERKAAANVSLLTSSIWTLIIPAAVTFLGYLIWRPPRPLPELQARTPGLRACLIGALVVGVLGFALNDSGVAVPAMMLAILLPYVAHLLVVEAR